MILKYKKLYDFKGNNTIIGIKKMVLMNLLKP